MATTLTELPDAFSAGTTVEYTKSFADYPASDGWTLTLYLAGVNVLKIEAVADGDAFDVTLAASETRSPFEPGLYRWVERVDKAGEVHEVDAGSVTVNRDLATAGDGDLQSWLERSIPILRAHIEGRLTAGNEGYAIAGRSVSKIPIKEAVELLSTLESRLARMKDPDKVSRLGLISFVRPGTNQ
jgi:hypothetical protein